MLKILLVLLLGLSALLALLILTKPSLAHGAGGRLLAFVSLFLLPGVALALGGLVHLETTKSTEFCLSCHVMEPYGASLHADSTDMLPAVHFQNHLVDREHACYSCHTDYTMYGDVTAKVRGVKHLWVNYVGTTPAKIELYTPYKNRECLGCHGGSRSFEGNEMHVDVRQELAKEETSCLECHDQVHNAAEVANLPRWGEETQP